MAKKKKSEGKVRYRSTETGRYVTKAFRKKNKKTTVKIRPAQAA